MVKSFCCPTEIATTLLTGYIPIPKKKKKSEQLNFIECTGIRCKSGNFSCTVCILFKNYHIVLALWWHYKQIL